MQSNVYLMYVCLDLGYSKLLQVWLLRSLGQSIIGSELYIRVSHLACDPRKMNYYYVCLSRTQPSELRSSTPFSYASPSEGGNPYINLLFFYVFYLVEATRLYAIISFDYNLMTMVNHMKSTEIPAGEFKAKCLHIMEEVKQKHVAIVITKYGKPIAKMVPIEEEKKTFFGCLSGTIVIYDDIIAPIDEQWEAES